jgi:hypothetical protein
MLFRLDNPRLVINAQEFPQNVVVYCLAYESCPGDLVVNYLDGGRRATEEIPITREFLIFRGMVVHEFVLPFQRLHDPLGRRGATAGFNVVARSSFRVAAASYGERTFEFTMFFPINGGGCIRFLIGGQEWEISNPAFDPQAPVPEVNPSYSTELGGAESASGPPGISNLRIPASVIINAYQRTHRGTSDSEAVERRRQERIANFDLQEVSGPALGGFAHSLDEVEGRRQERLDQIRAAEEARTEQGGSRIIIPAPQRPAKPPPLTRIERATREEEDES